MPNWFKRLLGRGEDPVAAELPPFDPGSAVTAREQHYDFAHRLLPEDVFEDPAGFLAAMESPHGAERLRDLWEAVGAAGGEPIALADGSLTVETATLANRRCAIITLPPPVAPPEAYFVAVVENSANQRDDCRYLVLEDTGADGTEGVLCEWFADGSRSNLEHRIAPSASAFKAIVAQELAREVARRSAGMTTTDAQRWLPSAGDPPPDEIEAMFAFSFRCLPCVFAFHVVPEAVFASGDGSLMPGASAGETLEERVARLWSEARSRCGDDAGEAAPPQVGALAERGLLILTMPAPLAPPEPYYVAVRGPRPTAEGRDGDSPAVYTLEMASENLSALPIVARIDGGAHAVLGSARSTDLSAFLDAIESHERGEGGFERDPPDTTAQITRYAAVAAKHTRR